VEILFPKRGAVTEFGLVGSRDGLAKAGTPGRDYIRMQAKCSCSCFVFVFIKCSALSMDLPRVPSFANPLFVLFRVLIPRVPRIITLSEIYFERRHHGDVVADFPQAWISSVKARPVARCDVRCDGEAIYTHMTNPIRYMRPGNPPNQF
jgi:hypothetical protein